jgi:hypothetical protein
MKNRFIVAIDSTTSAQNKAFKEYLQSAAELGWWHWLSNLWLIIDNSGKWSAISLRDKVKEFYPKEHLVIFVIGESGDTWAGFGPSTSQRDMFRWLRAYWKK